MGNSKKRRSAGDFAEELLRNSSWPPKFAGLSQRLIKTDYGALDFEDVTLRCFPLRAKMNRLQSFCDRFLNQDIPPEIAQFRPAAPYVLFAVINYGRMAATTSNMGWVAQNEILFTVPLVGRWNEWDEVEGSCRMVQDWASVSPFIFVDNDWSITTGREVYGWPKMPCRLEPGLNPWLRDPRLKRRLMTLKTLVIPELYKGRGTEYQTLLEIEQETPKVQMPADLEYVLNPFYRMSKAMLETVGSAPDMAQALAQLWRSPEGAGGEEAGPPIVPMVKQLFEALSKQPPNLFGNTINLKQFRSPLPHSACYQSLTNARMQVKRFNSGGLMGTSELLRGDPTGGISVLLHRQDAYPILDSLGIEVDSVFSTEGREVAVLKPILPFWTSLDLRYERARRICSRAEMPIPEEGEAPDPNAGWSAWQGAQTTDEVANVGAERLGTLETQLPPFNTTLGPVVEAVAGPFDFHDVTIRVLPLRASSERLKAALPSDGDLAPFEPLAKPRLAHSDEAAQDKEWEERHKRNDAFVYLVVTTYGRMSSAANDIGWWAKNEVGFTFLVTSEENAGLSLAGIEGMPVRPSEPKTLHWLHWPYLFADSPIAVTEGREVLGLPTAYCRIDQGRDPWLEPRGPETNDRLLSLSSLDYPAAGQGQQAEERLLLEIERSTKEPSQTEIHARKTYRTMAEHFIEKYLDRYGDGLRLRNLSVKEFRDEESPDRPCYQAVVAFDRMIKRRKGRDEIEEDHTLRVQPMRGSYEVKLHGSPSWQIADTLGLEITRREEDPTGADISVCEVVDPFWMRVDIRAELPVDRLHRSVNRPWSFPGYLPFAYNELWFRDIYRDQIAQFEDKFSEGLAEVAEGEFRKILEGASEELQRAAQALRRMWLSDPSIETLKTIDELVEELQQVRWHDLVRDKSLLPESLRVKKPATRRGRRTANKPPRKGAIKKKQAEAEEASKKSLADLVESAGTSGFAMDDDEQSSAQAAPRAQDIVRMIESLSIEVEDFSVMLDDGVATLGGTVASQDDREKVVLAVGNMAGIDRVEDRLEDEPPASPQAVPKASTETKPKPKPKPKPKQKKVAKAATDVAWPAPEFLDRYEGTYLFDESEDKLVIQRPFDLATESKKRATGLEAVLPLKNPIELVPGPKKHVFQAKGKHGAKRQFDFSPLPKDGPAQSVVYTDRTGGGDTQRVGRRSPD